MISKKSTAKTKQIDATHEASMAKKLLSSMAD